ncbi:MAG: phospholipase D family protein [Proteobacteria bacterium]|nr:phospholipase D family protein [Pseudomonadota bacterium]
MSINIDQTFSGRKVFSRLLIISFITLASACATVDFEAEKTPSYALPGTQDTFLGQAATQRETRPKNQSGFALIPDSINALAIRLLLAAKAERSLDVQYYMIKNDIIGRLFFATLVQAADRGVRVRLLIDDITTGGMDKGLTAVADHPNIELRLFNPFASRGLRAFDAWDLQRLNRRMHNKSFTADGQFTIIGGRNISAEYFAYNNDYNFADLDTLAVGPIVSDTAAMFDSYWNHRKAIPFKQLSKQKPDDGARLKKLRAALLENLEAIKKTPYASAVSASFEEYLERKVDYTWAPYQLVYDSPDKVIASKAEAADKITDSLLHTVLGAEKSLLVISPYFVPLKSGIAGISELQDSGVQIDILTNSLASGDHILVHSGYAPSRKPLLEHGVRFFEIREDLAISGTSRAKTDKANSSLHTKAFIVDKRYLFMGSFNWDPRSAYLNTELGVIIDSEYLAAKSSKAIYKAIPRDTYEVYLNQNKQLRWRTHDENGVEIVFDKEPHTSYWKRLRANLGRLLPIKSQL